MTLDKYIDDLMVGKVPQDDFPKNESSWEELFELCQRLIAEIVKLRRALAEVKCDHKTSITKRDGNGYVIEQCTWGCGKFVIYHNISSCYYRRLREYKTLKAANRFIDNATQKERGGQKGRSDEHCNSQSQKTFSV